MKRLTLDAFKVQQSNSKPSAAVLAQVLGSGTTVSPAVARRRLDRN